LEQTTILPRDQFEALEKEDQIRLIKSWIDEIGVQEIRKVWGFKYNTAYYDYLRKLGIKDEVVRKQEKNEVSNNITSKFSFELNQNLTGPEISDVLDRLSHFLNGEKRQYEVEIKIRPVANKEP